MADPERFDDDADPDPTFHADADPDPNFFYLGREHILNAKSSTFFLSCVTKTKTSKTYHV